MIEDVDSILELPVAWSAEPDLLERTRNRAWVVLDYHSAGQPLSPQLRLDIDDDEPLDDRLARRRNREEDEDIGYIDEE